LKSGVNFQVMLKQNCAKRNPIKHYLPVYIVFVNPLVPESSTQCTLQEAGI